MKNDSKVATSRHVKFQKTYKHSHTHTHRQYINTYVQVVGERKKKNDSNITSNINLPKYPETHLYIYPIITHTHTHTHTTTHTRIPMYEHTAMAHFKNIDGMLTHMQADTYHF